MPRLRRILTLGLTATLLTPAAPAPAFRDGFESPPVSGQVQRLPTGSHLGAWTVTAGTVDLATSRLWQTPTGRQTLDLDGDTNGTISTTITVRPLTTYKVTYALAGNPASALVTATVLVRPALRLMTGHTDPFWPFMGVPLAADLPPNGERRHFVRGKLNRNEIGFLEVLPIAETDSNHSS